MPLVFLAMRKFSDLLCNVCELLAGVFPGSFKESSRLRDGAHIALLFAILARPEELQ
jgi:hypothetical protein